MKSRILLGTLLSCAMLTSGIFGVPTKEEPATATEQKQSRWEKFKEQAKETAKKLGRATQRGLYKATGQIGKVITLQANGVNDWNNKVDLLARWIPEDLDQHFKENFDTALKSARKADKDATASSEFLNQIIAWSSLFDDKIEALRKELTEKQIAGLKKDYNKTIPQNNINRLNQQVNQYKEIIVALGMMLNVCKDKGENFKADQLNITYGTKAAASEPAPAVIAIAPAPAQEPVAAAPAPAPEPAPVAESAPAPAVIAPAPAPVTAPEPAAEPTGTGESESKEAAKGEDDNPEEKEQA
jgi:hypothetical protein